MDIIQDPTSTHNPSQDQVSSEYFFVCKKVKTTKVIQK